MTLVKRNFDLAGFIYPDKRKIWWFENDTRSFDEILADLAARIIESSDLNKNLVILRIADGEYQFLLGRRCECKASLRLLKCLYFRLLEYMKGERIYAATMKGVPSGQYSVEQYKKKEKSVQKSLRLLGRKGVLAAYLIEKDGFAVRQYFEPFQALLKNLGVSLTMNNYTPFYFVYRVLLDSKINIYQDRRILVITGDVDRKHDGITNYLISRGCRSVNWFEISRANSLFDQLDFTLEEFQLYDLVLLGAGVGKLSMTETLMQFRCPVLDAGYSLEVMNDELLRFKRDYCS